MKLLYLVNYWPGLFITDLFREIQWLRQRGVQRGCRFSWHSRPAFV